MGKIKHLISDYDSAELLKLNGEIKSGYVGLHDNKDLVNSIKTVLATLDDKSPVDVESIAFINRAISNTDGFLFNLVSYFDDGKIAFAILYRQYLVSYKHEVEFYQDVKLDYYMITETTNVNSPWRYLSRTPF